MSAIARRVPPGCDRTCLEGLLDAYVTAVVAHEPTRVPFARAAKFAG